MPALHHLSSSFPSISDYMDGNNFLSTTTVSLPVPTNSTTLAIIAVLALYGLYRFIFRTRTKTPVQHWTNESHGFNRHRRQKFPPAYPNGWFKLCDVDDLKNGRIQCVDALGQNMIVYMSKKKQEPVVMHAFCPHLGAHLGIGGEVSDKGVTCPFHGWTINEEGEVADIPYCTGSIPKGRVSPTYHSKVWMGGVWMWFHADNFTEEAERHAKLNDGELLYPPSWELRKINTFGTGSDVESWEKLVTIQDKHNHHILELSQNAPDYFHFNYLHNKFNFNPFINYFTDRLFTIHHETVMFQRDEETPELCKAHNYFTNHATVVLHLFGYEIPFSWVTQTTEVNFEGPGIIHFHIVTPIGAGHLVKSLLPIDHFKTWIEDSWYVDRKVPRFIGWLLAVTAKGALDQDKPIWENKTYHSKPLLVKGDGPFGDFKRWWMGFYSENSQHYSDEHRVDSLKW